MTVRLASRGADGIHCRRDRDYDGRSSEEVIRSLTVDSDYDLIAAGAPPSLQEVLPTIGTIGEFPLHFFLRRARA